MATDPAQRQAVLDALARGESVSAASRLSGVKRPAIYQWAARGDLEVRAALERAKARAESGAVPLIATRGELAKALGASVAAVKNWITRGLPKADGGYDLEQVRRWLAEHGLEPGRSGRPSALHRLSAIEARAGKPIAPAAASAAGDGGEAERQPGEGEEPPEGSDTADELVRKEALGKARQTWWKAKLDRLKALREEGLLVAQADVIAEHAQMIARARSRLLALPGAVSASVAAESDPRRVEAYLDTQIRLALEDLATSG